MSDWFEGFLAALDEANVRIQFWICPVIGHSEGAWRTELVATVEWRGDVAYCLAPDCNRTSTDLDQGER